MVYVCHKVGVLFPLCESCESHPECEKEAKARQNQVGQDSVPEIMMAVNSD